MTGRVKEILSWYGSDSPGTLTNLARLMNHGRLAGTGRFHPEADTLLLDGIPRNPNQARLMDDLIEVKAIFNLFCPVVDKLISRIQRRALKENRLDDANVDVIRTRLETYRRETRAVLNCYPENIIHQIDSTQEPMVVLLEILKVIARLPKPAVSDGTTVFSRPASHG